MKITNLTAIASLLLLTSCSPRVITSIVKTYPDMIPADSVYVIGLGEKVPNTAETIGRVSVSCMMHTVIPQEVKVGWTGK